MPGFFKDQPKGFLIGLTGGFFGGLAGLGGGIIMIPLMYWVMRFKQREAHGSSLMAIVFTSLVGSIIYFRNSSTDFSAAVILAASAMITARLGALYAHSLPEKKLKTAFGWFVICVCVLLVSKDTLLTLVFRPGPFGYYAILIITGILTGFLAGMMGVGGGSLMIPSLVICIGMSQHMAQGTSLLAMLPGSAVGGIHSLQAGKCHDEDRRRPRPGSGHGRLSRRLAGTPYTGVIPPYHFCGRRDVDGDKISKRS